MYQVVMANLGVDINLEKSLKSEDRNNIRFEFAKRIAFQNKEITGIPFDLLKLSTKSIYNLVDLYKFLIESN